MVLSRKCLSHAKFCLAAALIVVAVKSILITSFNNNPIDGAAGTSKRFSFVVNTKKYMTSLSTQPPRIWTPTRATDNLDPAKLTQGHPQMAKDVKFANAVIQAWNEEATVRTAQSSDPTISSETIPIEYQDKTDGATLYGHVIRTVRTRRDNKAKLPAILFFHTGAGPHDISLMWKADSLACNHVVFPDGCVIFVADILSDDTGWAWSPDRTKYESARRNVLSTGGLPEGRMLLQSRIRAALQALQKIAPEVDPDRMAAMGWCLGGHSILELGRMEVPGMRAMVTFHGVFDGVPASTSVAGAGEGDSKCFVLICNGQLDPFVDQDQVLPNAVETLKAHGCQVTVLELEGARHGFTNPAQDFNPSEAFAFNKQGAEQSWREALTLLREKVAATR